MGLIHLLKFSLICIDFLAWPVIALGYPLFASIRAVESGSEYHLRKLVVYWIHFASISLFEFVFQKIIQWIPLWSSLRLVVIFWLVMFRFDGASYAYQSLVRPILFVNIPAVIDKLHKEFIKENGSEALEKLIASKHECKECNIPQRDIQVLEPEVKNAAESSQQGRVADCVTMVTEAAVAKVKDTTPPVKKDEQQTEWTCDLCKVTTTNEKTLNAHLQGRKHQANCESLKAHKLHAESTVPSLLETGKVKKTVPHKASVENSRPETPPIKKGQQEWTCGLCKVKTTSEKTLNDHRRGRKHKSKRESLKANAKDTGPSHSTAAGKLNLGDVDEAVKNDVSQKAGKKSQERFLLQAARDKQKRAEPKHDGGANQIFKQYCNVCDVKMLSEADLVSHVKGKKHLSNIRTTF